jgi:hypothetical protein
MSDEDDIIALAKLIHALGAKPGDAYVPLPVSVVGARGEPTPKDCEAPDMHRKVFSEMLDGLRHREGIKYSVVFGGTP